MKARVKETGEIVEVMQVYDKGKPSFERLDVLDTKVIQYSIDELDFSEEIGLTGKEYWEALGGKAEPIYPDYWTRLEHQATIAAMQGLMTILPNIGGLKGRTPKDEIVDIATSTSHALVQKLKEKEERK